MTKAVCTLDMVENNFPELSQWMELSGLFPGKLSGSVFYQIL